MKTDLPKALSPNEEVIIKFNGGGLDTIKFEADQEANNIWISVADFV